MEAPLGKQKVNQGLAPFIVELLTIFISDFQEALMRNRAGKSISLLVLLMSLGSSAFGATISGTVKDSDGSPIKGAFVQARSGQMPNFSVVVLSDWQGQYRMENLSPGEYQVFASKIGHRATSPTPARVADGPATSLNFDLPKAKVRWTEVSLREGQLLLPEGPGKGVYFDKCTGCHGFQRYMAGVRTDLNGWHRVIQYMRNEMRVSLTVSFKDEDENLVASWFNQVFGVDSDAPASPEDLPNFQQAWRGEYSDESMNIVYSLYDLPSLTPRLYPFSARPDEQDIVWLPSYAQGAVGKLDPKTGKVDVYRFTMPPDPVAGTRAAVHGSAPSPDGRSVWLAVTDNNRVGKLDRRTGEIGLFTPPPAPAQARRMGLQRGSVHDVWSDSKGIVWTAGGPVQRFDPKTEQWTQIRELPGTYGMVIDQNDDVWETEFRPGGAVAKVDGKTFKVTKYYPPNKRAQPRRVVVDSKGNVWVGDWSGALLRFDPRTESFREYKIPGPEPTPYSIQVDKDDRVWFTSHNNDYLGRLDPQTGRFTAYPLPVSDIGTREMYRDSQGRMWVASPPNDKVISFTPPGM